METIILTFVLACIIGGLCIICYNAGLQRGLESARDARRIERGEDPFIVEELTVEEDYSKPEETA
jgi:hypothetical protein